jgi:hypothetical protein
MQKVQFYIAFALTLFGAGISVSGFQKIAIILKTAVSHRGTETTEAANEQLELRQALRNHYPQGEDKTPEKPSFPLALCSP